MIRQTVYTLLFCGGDDTEIDVLSLMLLWEFSWVLYCLRAMSDPFTSVKSGGQKTEM